MTNAWYCRFRPPLHVFWSKWIKGRASYDNNLEWEETMITDEMRLGWNACRRQVFLLSEHEQDEGPYSKLDTEWADGYRHMAKSFGKAFSAFGPDECDYLIADAANAAPSKAIEALRLYEAWEAIPADRGGKNGPKGRAYAAFLAAKDEALNR